MGARSVRNIHNITWVPGVLGTFVGELECLKHYVSTSEECLWVPIVFETSHSLTGRSIQEDLDNIKNEHHYNKHKLLFPENVPQKKVHYLHIFISQYHVEEDYIPNIETREY